jgi:hypothetical protein
MERGRIAAVNGTRKRLPREIAFRFRLSPTYFALVSTAQYRLRRFCWQIAPAALCGLALITGRFIS